MSGIEAVLIGCVAVNTAINVGQSSGFFAWIKRKFRLIGSRLVSVSCQSNPMVTYCICKTLSAITKDEKIRTLVTITVNGKGEVFYIPDFGAEVYITTNSGTLYIKPISLDGYNLTAFELSCWNSDKDIIDIFMNNIFKFYSDNFSTSTIEYFGNIVEKNLAKQNEMKDTTKLLESRKPDLFDEIFSKPEKSEKSEQKQCELKQDEQKHNEPIIKADTESSATETTKQNANEMVPITAIIKTQAIEENTTNELVGGDGVLS